MGGLGESGCGDAGINWKEERDGKEGGGVMPQTENKPQIKFSVRNPLFIVINQ